ncbi:uncharacterized protein PODANS_4_7880 [Podospora anserina S mat+]|uniref:Podospora anserina S mat+ genomic DNA chromosome 4, supercontig 4 n=1 Tax=Podospora anserina (strain S / ATCC MYA-4624 / DSM 980 / FGSC 10383) TaxID=515849 RepID=B2ARD3_PODAN|nr:uncharacterized protein PODANS_4_7880 [Podospora anserina S mat+]CAP66711.1 unnamed protein product [Podospora anserina S mat+]CDP28446.1 Putative protein of unknown function [Podospora anserina S mat+]
MERSDCLIPRWDENRTEFDKFELNFKGWCYLRPDKVYSATTILANYFIDATWTPSVDWEITVQEPTPETPISPLPGREGLAYVALNLLFTTTDGGSEKLASESNCRSYFNELSKQLIWPCLDASRNKIQIDFVTWKLEPSWGYSTAFSRYWLKGWSHKPTQQQMELPAYNISYVLRDLTNLKGLRKGDTCHDSCPKGAVVECTKHLLRQAQQELAEVRKTASGALRQPFGAEEEENVEALIEENIRHAVATNNSIRAILNILNRNVGLGRSRFFFMRILRRILNRPKYLNMVITDKTFGSKKESMSGDVNFFECIARTMAGHIRLRSAATRHKLRGHVQEAVSGTLEETQLVSYFGLVAAKVGQQAHHDAALDKVGQHYFDAFWDVEADIEALIQILDNEYAANGEKMFRKKRKAVPKGTPRCLLEKAALNEKLDKLENDSDSELEMDEEYDEKY